MNTIARGNAAEAAVLLALAKADIPALVPFGGGIPFDIAAVMPDGGLVRIQVKSGRVRKGCILFNTAATDHGRGRLHYRDRADYLAVYAATLDQVFVVHVEDCPSFVGALRLVPPRNNQQRRVRLAENHTFERWLEQDVYADCPDLRHASAARDAEAA